jgi:hypothetical protein
MAAVTWPPARQGPHRLGVFELQQSIILAVFKELEMDIALDKRCVEGGYTDALTISILREE